MKDKENIGLQVVSDRSDHWQGVSPSEGQVSAGLNMATKTLQSATWKLPLDKRSPTFPMYELLAWHDSRTAKSSTLVK